MKIIQNLAPQSKYSIKCPYSMVPEQVTVHNTDNDASAKNEIAYMIRNNKKVSFHYAADDKEIIQGIPENRNGWHAGDGHNGYGNRKTIGIEICYSMSGGERFIKAEQNAAKLVADILKRYNWGIDKVKRHKDWSGKNCPARTMQMGWQRFLDMVSAELKGKEESVPVKDLTTNVVYYEACHNSYVSIVDALKSIGVDSSKANRKLIADVNGISNYTGTASQNSTLVKLLKAGMLIKSKTVTVDSKENTDNKYYPKYTGNTVSIVTALNSLKIKSSFDFRKQIAVKNNITNYKGTAEQNTKMLNLLKQGYLIKV